MSVARGRADPLAGNQSDAKDPELTFLVGRGRLRALVERGRLRARSQGEFEMRRTVLVCAVLATLFPKYADAAERIWRVGVIALADDSTVREVIWPSLATRGFVQGRNLVVDARSGPEEKLPEIARALIGDKPDAIVATSDWALHAARAVTRTIPIIVSPMGADPVAAGDAESWAHPGATSRAFA
jgi:ABC-type uncharacterized transport system substrate-binding protein